MKKKLLAALAVFAAVGVALGGLIWAGKSSGEAKLRAFFTLAKDGSPTQIEAQLSDKLSEQVDPELGASYVKVVATRFGDFQSVRLNGFEFSDTLEGASRIRDLQGTFVFAQRELPVHVQFIDDKLSAIKIADPIEAELIEAANRVPTRTDAYERGGDAFYRAVMDRKVDLAFGMLAEDLKKQVGRPTFADTVGKIAAEGPLKSITRVSATPQKAEPDNLDVIYRLTCANGALEARATYRFRSLRGELTGFNVTVL